VQGREQVVGLRSVGRSSSCHSSAAHDFLGELPRAEQLRRRKRLGKADVFQFPDRQPGQPVPLLLVAQILEGNGLIASRPTYRSKPAVVRRVGIDRAGFCAPSVSMNTPLNRLSAQKSSAEMP